MNSGKIFIRFMVFTNFRLFQDESKRNYTNNYEIRTMRNETRINSFLNAQKMKFKNIQIYQISRLSEYQLIPLLFVLFINFTFHQSFLSLRKKQQFKYNRGSTSVIRKAKYISSMNRRSSRWRSEGVPPSI